MSSIQLVESEGIQIIRLQGLLGGDVARELGELLESLLSQGQEKIVLNMVGVTEVTAGPDGGVATLNLAHRRVIVPGAIIVGGYSKRVLEVFQLTRLSRSFLMYQTEEDAIQSFAKET